VEGEVEEKISIKLSNGDGDGAQSEGGQQDAQIEVNTITCTLEKANADEAEHLDSGVQHAKRKSPTEPISTLCSSMRRQIISR
jgi:hypothetical protein